MNAVSPLSTDVNSRHSPTESMHIGIHGRGGLSYRYMIDMQEGVVTLQGG